MDDKLDLKSLDIKQDKIEQLKKIFPEVVTEGKVDFERLKSELGEELETGKERYEMKWPGKANLSRIIQEPSIGTLRPIEEDSVDFDSTENLFIEGDSLEVLKLLQKSYYGKVKMIYIDPPYNTGNDFVYPDNYSESLDTYLRYTGQKGEEGLKLTTNAETDGRYHSKWMNMIYPRIFLARNLLKDDGVIFISIDDHEVDNLKKICNEIFGEENFVGELVWEKKKKGAYLANDLTNIKEYVMVFAKGKEKFNGLIGEIASEETTYPVIKTTNTRGVRTIAAGITSKYREKNLTVSKGKRITDGNMEMILLDDLIIDNGVLMNNVSVESNWIYSQKLLDEFAQRKELYITQDLYFRRIVKEPRMKKLKDILPRVGEDGKSGDRYYYTENLFEDGWGTNEDGNAELHRILGIQNLFDFPKPSKLIAKLIASLKDKEALILDFLAGSATTADSVMQVNIADHGTRKYIMVQLPEQTIKDSEAFRAGYKNIAEIGKERIRRVIKNIKEENTGKLDFENKKIDLGFKVFRLDVSNFKIWDKKSGVPLQQQLQLSVSNIRDDRSDEEILYEIILKSGFELSVKVEKLEISGKSVYSVDDKSLLVCLEKELSQDFIKGIADLGGARVVILDRSFDGNDQLKTNTVELMKGKGVEFKTV